MTMDIIKEENATLREKCFRLQGELKFTEGHRDRLQAQIEATESKLVVLIRMMTDMLRPEGG